MNKHTVSNHSKAGSRCAIGAKTPGECSQRGLYLYTQRSPYLHDILAFARHSCACGFLPPVEEVEMTMDANIRVRLNTGEHA